MYVHHQLSGWDAIMIGGTAIMIGHVCSCWHSNWTPSLPAA